jgi:hypothetical protein
MINADDYPIYFYLTGTTVNSTISGNTMVSGDYGIEIELYNAANLTATISDNVINVPYYAASFYSANSSILSIDMVNNTLTAFEDDYLLYAETTTSSNTSMNLSNNTVLAGTQGVYFDNAGTGPTSLSINNNVFSYSNGGGVEVVSSGANNLYLEINGNTFNGFVTNAINVQSSAGTACLEMNNNTSNLFPNAYLLNQTGGTFNLVTPVGNIGQLTETGTITPVSSCD